MDTIFTLKEIVMKQVPQIILADRLTQNWPCTLMKEAHGEAWVVARPWSLGNVFTRVKLAWKVFTGDCDALKWYRQ